MGKLSNTQSNLTSRTVGKQTARLLNALYDRSQSTFTLAEAAKITGLSAHLASSLLHKAAKRGLVSRLKGGLFTIIPVELGSGGEYAGNPYLTAQKLMGGAPGFISHASAMEIHRMVTQPQLVVFASSAKRISNRNIYGTEFRFVLIRPSLLFGTTKHWVTKQEQVEVSDLERTVIDGLRQPEYCGGITDVAKGLWMRRQDMKVTTLVEYATRVGIGAVTRRLGYLLDLYALAPADVLAKLQSSLSATYVALDPVLPREGPHLKRWRLQVNIPPQELEIVRGT